MPPTGPNKPAPGGPGVYPEPPASLVGATPAPPRRSRTAAELDSLVDGIVEELDRRARERIVAESDEQIAAMSQTIVNTRRSARRMRAWAIGTGASLGSVLGALVLSTMAAAATGVLDGIVAVIKGAQPPAVVARVEAIEAESAHAEVIATAGIVTARMDAAHAQAYADALADLQVERDAWMQLVLEANAKRRRVPPKPEALVAAEATVALLRQQRKVAP